MAQSTQFSIRRLGLATAWAAVACWLIRVSLPLRGAWHGPEVFNPILMLGIVIAVTAIGIPLRRGPGFAIAALPISFVVQIYVAHVWGEPLLKQLQFATRAAIFLGVIAAAYLVARWMFRRWTGSTSSESGP